MFNLSANKWSQKEHPHTHDSMAIFMAFLLLCRKRYGVLQDRVQVISSAFAHTSTHKTLLEIYVGSDFDVRVIKARKRISNRELVDILGFPTHFVSVRK